LKRSLRVNSCENRVTGARKCGADAIADSSKHDATMAVDNRPQQSIVL
jgi:hypothetical protein